MKNKDFFSDIKLFDIVFIMLIDIKMPAINDFLIMSSFYREGPIASIGGGRCPY